MARIVTWEKSKLPLWCFPLVYIGWAWGFWSFIIVSDKNVWTLPNFIFLIVGGLSPVIAGLGSLWISLGREGIQDLWCRLIEIHRIRINWFIFIILFYPVLNFIVALFAFMSDKSVVPIKLITMDRLFSPSSFLLMMSFALIFPFVEEIGLRGYWLDRLQERFSALSASLIIGILWGIWHLPLFFMEGYYEESNFDPDLSLFLFNIMIASIIYTVVYNICYRSLLAIIIFHFMENITGEIIGLTSSLHLYIILIKALLALFFIWWIS